METGPLHVFLSYSHRDEAFRQELLTHLAVLRHQGLIDTWADCEITAGDDWQRNVRVELERADLILLLLSADFLASDWAFGTEATLAIERHRAGQARVVPIILRAVSWQATPFAVFQAFPRNGKPVTSFRNRDEAWVEIANGLRRICEELLAHRRGAIAEPTVVGPRDVFPLFEVFKASGVPGITFVEPDSFGRLKMSVTQPGRGVVIQGPSGVGKTTALRKAAEAVSTAGDLRLLSARRTDDVQQLKKIEQWHSGLVAVDDVHRLDQNTRQYLADYLKDLADREDPQRKLIIVGIPRTGQMLVDLAFDLATRIDVFNIGKVSDAKILRMIEIGEEALNIRFDRKTEIAGAASGSLNIAQLLCYDLSAAAEVFGTQPSTKQLATDVEAAVSNVLKQVGLKFGELVRTFASLGNKRDLTCIEILQELARTDDGVLAFPVLRDLRPDLTAGIDRFLKSDYMTIVRKKIPYSEQHLLFDASVPALVIDDPQLTFYLLQTPVSLLGRTAGKSSVQRRTRVFVSYSHVDAAWLERLRVHLKPLERDGAIDLWDDTRIKAGAVWREEIAKAIDSARVAVLLISADFLASDFIVDNELPPLLTAAAKDGLVTIPVIVSPSRFSHDSELSQFQAVNAPSLPLSAMSRNDQEQLLVKVSAAIEGVLES
jgi:hypothetical protein